MTLLPARKTSSPAHPLPPGADASQYVRAEDINGILDHVSGWVNVKSYGAIGDGVTDDTAATIAGAAAAVTAQKPLYFPPGTYYLSSQAAPISSDGLTVVGAGYVKAGDVPVNWGLMGGDGSQFAVVKSALMALPGAHTVIASRYNGAIFSGKALAGSDFTVLGDASQASSSTFVQSTPTTYPGWSQALKDLARFSAFYFGSHGIEVKGGLEIVTLREVSVCFSGGYNLYVHQTVGVNSPVEYLKIDRGSFIYGLLGNVFLDGIAKDIDISGLLLNDPGQIARLDAAGAFSGGFTRANIVYPIRLRPAPVAGLIAAINVRVRGCFAEESQGVVLLDTKDGALYQSVRVEENFLLPYKNTWPFYHADFEYQTIDLLTNQNGGPSGARFYFATGGVHNNSSGIDLREIISENGATIDGYRSLQWQSFARSSATLGTGVGNPEAVSYTPPETASHLDIGTNTAEIVRLYLVTANFQSTQNDNFGAYLVAIIHMPSGNFAGTVTAFGATTGFAAAPTVTTAGAISLSLSQYYRARVTRIDSALLTSNAY